jgi:hypothetical protein
MWENISLVINLIDRISFSISGNSLFKIIILEIVDKSYLFLEVLKGLPTQPLHTSQLLKPGKHKYRIQTKAHAHPHTPKH